MLKSREAAEEAQPAFARLMTSSRELVRAETALVLQQGKAFSIRALIALVATFVAGGLLQVALVIGVLYPLIEPEAPGAGWAVAIAVPGSLALLSLVIAAISWVAARSQIVQALP